MYEIRYSPSGYKSFSRYFYLCCRIFKSTKKQSTYLTPSTRQFQSLKTHVAPIHPIQLLEGEYRLLAVKNYAVLYVVTENMVEIGRIAYAKMDLMKITN